MRALLLLLALASAGCGTTTAAPDATPDVAAPDAAPDAGATDAAPDAGAGPADAGTWTPDARSPATAIEAPMERWTWVPFPDAVCGDGSATGIGVNLSRRSDRVLIFVQGGGGCWDWLTCYSFGTAANLTGYGEPDFQREIGSAGRMLIFDRADMRNPFRDASFVFVPYCTGDIHAGNRVIAHRWGARETTTYHVGHRNIGSYLRRLAPTFPRADRVWLSGVSAGGYGAAINWEQVQEAFPMARVDVLDDSGPPVQPVASRLAAMQAAWNIQYPRGCPDCAGRFDALTGYFLRRYGATHRFALLSYTRDRTISTYMGLTPEQFEESLTTTVRAQLEAAPGARYFYVPGADHVMLGAPDRVRAADGTVLLDWLRAFATDDVAWRASRP